jgi:hypothetical protein
MGVYVSRQFVNAATGCICISTGPCMEWASLTDRICLLGKWVHPCTSGRWVATQGTSLRHARVSRSREPQDPLRGPEQQVTLGTVSLAVTALSALFL